MQFTFEKVWKVLVGSVSYMNQRKLVNYVENCEMFMSQFKPQVKLNVLPLGSYDVLIGMDWLEKQKVVVNCFEKPFTCIDDKWERNIVKGIPRKVYVRQILALKMKEVVRKGCKVFVVHIINNEHKEPINCWEC